MNLPVKNLARIDQLFFLIDFVGVFVGALNSGLRYLLRFNWQTRAVRSEP